MGHVRFGWLPYSASMSEASTSGLLDLSRKWSVSLTKDVAARVFLYFRRLLEWNVRVNLTGARSMADLMGDHMPDSFAVSRLVPADSDLVDVGSGGGLPAIPFSIIRPDCRVTLLEPRAKRIAFLNTAVRECGCANVRVVRGRIEDWGTSRFSVATSRATFPPDEWLEKAPLLLGSGGRIILLTTVDGRHKAGDHQVVDSVEYQTSTGTRRWAGCFCSTWNTPEAD